MRIIILLLLLLTVSVAATAQTRQLKKDSTEVITLTAWQLGQLKSFDDQAAKIREAAQLNDVAREVFIKTLIGRDLVERDSVRYEAPSIVIYRTKQKKP